MLDIFFSEQANKDSFPTINSQDIEHNISPLQLCPLCIYFTIPNYTNVDIYT